MGKEICINQKSLQAGRKVIPELLYVRQHHSKKYRMKICAVFCSSRKQNSKGKEIERSRKDVSNQTVYLH